MQATKMKTDGRQPIGVLAVCVGFSQGCSHVFEHIAVAQGAGTPLFVRRPEHAITVELFKGGMLDSQQRGYMYV